MYAKILLLTVYLVFFHHLSGQSCLPGGLFLNTQTQADQFATLYPGCKVIEGGIFVSSKDIRHLDGLQQITNIQGDLRITNCDSLVQISGLKNMTEIGGAVRIQNNPQLSSLGLHTLKRVRGDYFYISSNPLLKNLKEINRLDSVFGIFQIWNQDSLTSISGLDSLQFVGKDFALFRNKQLKDLTGLGGLLHIEEGFRIYENPVLHSVQGLSKNLKIDGSLVINDNPVLSDCAAYAFCAYIKNPPSFVVFTNNLTGCNSVQEVQTSCLSASGPAPDVPAFKIFPNPASDFIQWEGTPNVSSPMSILDVNGRTHISVDMKDNTGISIGHLPEGMYVLKVGTHYSKMVVRR